MAANNYQFDGGSPTYRTTASRTPGRGGYVRKTSYENPGPYNPRITAPIVTQNMTTSPSFDAFMNALQGVPPVDATDGGGGGGGGGGGRRSGGGGGGGVSAATRDAYRAMYNNMRGNTAIDDAWARYEQSMRGTYDPAKFAQKWDTAKGEIGSAAGTARGRLGDIYDQLVARAQTARQGVAGSVAAGDQRLRDIQARFGAQSAGATNQLNDVLGRFDAGGLSGDGYMNEINNQALAAQLANAQAGNAYDLAYADRPAVYGALNSDILSGMTAQEQALYSRIAAQRAAEAQSNEAALAQILGQSGISRAQAAVEQQRSLDQLRAEMAGMGITV